MDERVTRRQGTQADGLKAGLCVNGVSADHHPLVPNHHLIADFDDAIDVVDREAGELGRLDVVAGDFWKLFQEPFHGAIVA
jgi:hypothetical protein